MSSWFASLQNVLPQHGLSRAMGGLASSQVPWVKNTFINVFANAYKISLDEAQANSFDEFASFNDFFTRALKDGARPIAEHDGAIVSPADGAVSQLGDIEQGHLLQAKRHTYSLTSLAGQLAPGFDQGTFCTIYLAPSDYHRVHLPFGGELTHTLAVPGELFSVNNTTANSVTSLFARNERLVCRFETELGPMLVVLVGAMIVASIATDWLGPTSPYHEEELNEHGLVYAKGDEIGRFLLGSTVICCFPKGQVQLRDDLAPGSVLRMGEVLAERAR